MRYRLVHRRAEAATRPPLEQTGVSAAGSKPVSKALKFGSAVPEVRGKTEAMALPGEGGLALINNDDFWHRRRPHSDRRARHGHRDGGRAASGV